MQEIWKDIEGYEGLYQISNLGNVYSFKSNKILKTYLWSGYPNVNLTKNKKRKGVQIHRLVAQAFIPNLYNYSIVNHLDYDRTNARADNLEWCTQKQNVNYSICNMKNINHVKNKDMYGICFRNRKGGYYEITIKQKYYGQYKNYEDAKKKRDEVLNELNIAI